jgi:tyrosine-specific transport protein
MSYKPGSIFGGSLLIAGSCIGAGMLALPIQTGLAGFVPFVVMFICCWAFMTCTGLLLLEVNLWFGDNVSIVTMAKETLGQPGKIIAWLTFCFLFYSLMVAYVAGSGTIFVDLLETFVGITCPRWVASIVVTFFLGGHVYFGALAVDRVNRIFMCGLILVYIVLIFVGMGHIRVDLLSHSNWPRAFFTLPIMVVMFGYHNLIPSLTMYFKRQKKRLLYTIILGSAISFVVCLLWEWIILGMVPAQDIIASANKGQLATRALQNIVGLGWVSTAAQLFSLFAIVTSCLGVALSFVDFLADGLHFTKKSPRNTLMLCFLVMAPAFVFSLMSPKVFFTALNYAGGFAAVVLFGVIPALMVWIGRYNKKIATVTIVPGGKKVLVLVMLIALTIFSLELVQELGLAI